MAHSIGRLVRQHSAPIHLQQANCCRPYQPHALRAPQGICTDGPPASTLGWPRSATNCGAHLHTHARREIHIRVSGMRVDPASSSHGTTLCRLHYCNLLQALDPKEIQLQRCPCNYRNLCALKDIACTLPQLAKRCDQAAPRCRRAGESAAQNLKPDPGEGPGRTALHLKPCRKLCAPCRSVRPVPVSSSTLPPFTNTWPCRPSARGASNGSCGSTTRHTFMGRYCLRPAAAHVAACLWFLAQLVQQMSYVERRQLLHGKPVVAR